MIFLKKSMILGGMILTLIGCSGGSDAKTNPSAPGQAAVPKPPDQPAPDPATPSPTPTATLTPEPGPGQAPGPVQVPVKQGFTFNPAAPQAKALPFDPGDEATPHPRTGKLGAAGVFVYTVRDGQRKVLLAKRASWLKGAGEWSVFGGVVETTDQDSTGKVSYARAAEHELYEETVTVYHETDARAMRLCPTHMTTFRSGFKVRTFFVKQKHVPASVFNQGFRHAESHKLPMKFRENEKFRWVPLEDLMAAAATGTPAVQVLDGKGTSQTLDLHGPFFRALSEPGYLAVLKLLS